MKQEKLYPMIRKKFMELLNGYIEVENVDELIVAPGLDDDQGIKGCIALAIKEQILAEMNQRLVELSDSSLFLCMKKEYEKIELAIG